MRIHLIAAVVLACCALGAVADDLNSPVLPGWGKYFWNKNAVWYLYPPAFDNTNVAGAVSYRFEVTDDTKATFAFTAPKPTDSLAPVWPKVKACGMVTVTCRGLAADGRDCGAAGPKRTFWKSAAFNAAKYPPKTRPYAEAALKQYAFVFDLPHIRKMVETGKLDHSYLHNCYPTKMNACIVSGALRYAELVPAERERMLRIARAAADCLIDLAEPAGAPLAGFTPTYAKGSTFVTAQKYAGQNMLCYPSSAGSAFLGLARATGEAKYREAARRIADTYLRLQGADGTWYLKLWEKDGKPVTPNRLLPFGVCEFLSEMAVATGEAKYRAAADRGFAYIERGPLKNWNWEGQFEDVTPTPRYENLTHHPPCSAALYLLKRYPDDRLRLMQARELLRFSEDQFIAWERPCRADGVTPADKNLKIYAATWGVLPTVVEQYYWRVPVNASIAKLIQTFLALHKAEHDPLDLAKAKVLGDALTRAQSDYGCIPTECVKAVDPKSKDSNWINCQLAAAAALDELARAVAEEEKADGLRAGFANPPNAARPQVWWHWMNGNVSKAGITADLEAMAKAGIGGAHVFDVGCNVPAGGVAFATPKWDEHLQHAIREAGRLGLKLTIVNCSGYANAGGPWVAPSNSMFYVTCSETKMTGGARLAEPLSRGVKKDNGFYRDIAVLAFPQPKCEVEAPKDVKVEKPGADVVVFSAAKPMNLCGVMLSMELSAAWAWDRYLDMTVEASDDGRTWRPACKLTTIVINAGKSECNSADGGEKLIAFERPVTARFIRITGDARRATVAYGDSTKAHFARLKPVFRYSLPDLNERIFRVSAPVKPVTAKSLPEQVVDKAKIVDLTARLAADGRLDWCAPAGGDWIVLRIGYYANGVQCHPCSQFGGGPEVDKLDPAAVRRHLEAYALKYADRKSVAGVLCDSYEVGCQNWTHGFEALFAKRKGYSIVPYLAAFSGRVVGSAVETDRALRDYRGVVSDLFCESFAGVMSELCAKTGMKASIEPYGNGPFNETSYGWYTSQPMTEFWVAESADASKYARPWYCTLAQRVASSAHLRGIPYVDAEGFTAFPTDGGRWLKDPFGLKAYGDLMYACGVTRMVYHRWAHQPWTAPERLPGMTMGQWGSHFERTETWWPMVGPWLKYQARCQYLLQQGHVAADILVFDGDDVPRAGVDQATLPAGIGYDIFGKEALARLTVKNGKLKCLAGTEYGVLYVPGNVWVSPESEKRIAALKAQGAKVVHDLAELKIAPDFSCPGAPRVRAIHRQYAQGREAYFVAYPSTNAATVTCSFRVTGKVPQFWDAESGKITEPRVWREAAGRTEVEIAFKPCGAMFVMFVPKTEARVAKEARPETVAKVALDGAWSLAFPKGWNCPERVDLPKLVSWTDLTAGEAKYFSGIAEYAYRGKAEVRAAAGQRVVLKLGEVKNLAEVTVNGRTFEPLWRPPYELDVTEALRTDGAFELRVKVANLWPNRLIGDAKKGEDCEWEGKALKAIPDWVKAGKPSPIGRLTFTTWRHWQASDKLLPSGLLGPVGLTFVR